MGWHNGKICMWKEVVVYWERRQHEINMGGKKKRECLFERKRECERVCVREKETERVQMRV